MHGFIIWFEKGEIVNEANIIAKRTNGLGLSPIYYTDIIGKKLNKDVVADHIFDINDFEE